MLNELSENSNKEKNIKMETIKENQSEMKNTLSEMKNMLDGINIVDKEEDRTTNIEDGEAKDNQNGKKKEAETIIII